MSVNWRINGALAANATTVTMPLTAPSTGVVVNDIYVAIIASKEQVVGAPAGWASIIDTSPTSDLMVLSLYWKRVELADIGATFNFLKDVDDNLLMWGFITCFSGCLTSATPIDATTPSSSINASSDTVTYATFDPTETAAFVVAVGAYNNDNTTAGAMSGTDPTFTNRADLETGTGSDGSLFLYTGASSGAATGSRTHSTTSTADATNIGVLFGLVEEPVAATTGTGWDRSSRGMWW